MSDDIIKSEIIFYQRDLYEIGGIETFLYELMRGIGKSYNITLLYKSGHINQIKRLKQYVRCIKYTDQKVECNKYICTSAYDNIADRVTSYENFYGQCIHADFKALRWIYRKHPKTNIHLAVSEIAKAGILEQSPDIKVIIAHNPLLPHKPKRVLKLISAQRLSEEKGGNKIINFARKLNEMNIPFVWQVFSNRTITEKIDGLVMRKPTLEIWDYINDADYYVSMSDTESWGYSTYEAFCLGTPVICNDYPAIHEQRIIDGVNGFIVNKDLSNLEEVIKKAYAKKLKGFKYDKLSYIDEWFELLGESKEKNTYNPKKADNYIVTIQAVKNYFDMQENRNIIKDEKYNVSFERADEILKAGFCKVIQNEHCHFVQI